MCQNVSLFMMLRSTSHGKDETYTGGPNTQWLYIKETTWMQHWGKSLEI